ncbi:TetR/AcrR family transcriptional regulator [Isoptericola sp. 4D.3]|jgi:AcrR family transcriptional regulator|uniref:TetR/AcrR family transcriptional regulator n=1 Tax=Isoptericola peretonis TaxID=2918523 RepID=A0ABT0J0X8_9MICO|nr:TetR/AcrR family transcriptional regulator [Isoptericola sp. 4D.3]
MPPPPAARAKVLRAFAELLVESGERSATLEAVADRAGVSKGGLLYHFPSKDALVDGLLDHLGELTAADVETMRAAPEGPADYLLRTSTVIDGDFGVVYLAASRLAQGAYPRARDVLDDAQTAWTATVRQELGDPVLARAVSLMGEGLYALASFGTTSLRDRDIDDLLVLVREVAATRSAGEGSPA